MCHGAEPVLDQAFIPEPSIEARVVGVVVQLAGLDETQLHIVLVCPGIEHLAFGVWFMVDRD